MTKKTGKNEKEKEEGRDNGLFFASSGVNFDRLKILWLKIANDQQTKAFGACTESGFLNILVVRLSRNAFSMFQKGRSGWSTWKYQFSYDP